MKKFLVFDTETGGLDPTLHSLLTATFRVVDQHLNTLDQLELKLKPDDGVYRVTPKAMEVNNIDLVEHDKEAISYNKAKYLLLTFLNRHSDQGVNKLTPVGQNVPFDIRFVQHHLLSEKEWGLHVSHRVMDTASIAEFLKYCLIIPNSVGGLEKLAAFFGVHEKGAHNATVDVNMTVNVLKAMKQRMTLK